jgi:hypothetical protein
MSKFHITFLEYTNLAPRPCQAVFGARRRSSWTSPSEKFAAVRNIRDMIKEWLFNPPDNAFNIKQLIQKA